MYPMWVSHVCEVEEANNVRKMVEKKLNLRAGQKDEDFSCKDQRLEVGAGGFSSRERPHPLTSLQVGHFLCWESCRHLR